jgi:hypothetical protein
LTPNKVITKERTKSERFGVVGNEIQSERIIRVIQNDNFISKNSKISEVASKGSAKEEKKEPKK